MRVSRWAIPILFLFLPQGGWTEPAHQRVLLIHSFSRDFAPFSAVAQSFRSELASLNERKVEFVEVSLQTFQAGGIRQAEALADFVAASFPDRPPDLAVAIGAPAAQFYLGKCAKDFAGTPLLIAGADQRRLGDLPKDAPIASASLELDLDLLLDDLRLARPGLRRIHYVTGVTPMEKFWEKEAIEAWSRDGIVVETLSDHSFAEVLEIVRELPPDSAVFIGILDRDAAGVPFEAHAALRDLREATGVPIFGMAVQQLGLGIVGGHLIDMELAGRRAAVAAARMLSGTTAGEIEIEPVTPGPPVYDFRELKRWKISEKQLPPGSKIRFRPPTLWQTHRNAVLAGGGVIAAQFLLIFFLFSARKKAREMHKQLDLAADAAGAGFCRIDVGRGVIRASRQWMRLFGFSGADPVSLDEAVSRVHPEDRLELKHGIDQAADEGRSYEVEHRVVLPDGSQRWIASLGKAEKGSGEESLRIQGVSIDISARKRNEAEIERQREALSHLSRVGTLGVISGSLAHELNQPLGIVLSNAQAAQRMLSRPDPDLEEIREILSDIVSEDRRAGEVIQRWRTLLRKGEVQRTTVQACHCFEEVLKLTRSELDARDIVLKRDCPEQLPEILADPIQLQQVFLNLILNARDAVLDLPADRRVIEIRGWSADGQLGVVVRDHGVGLPPDREKLFEPFHTTKETGLGMGLAICRTILTHLGGRLWAEVPEGYGAEFHLSIPLAAKET